MTLFEMTCDEPWFSFLRKGVKPVEGRKNSPKHRSIRPGDTILFKNGDDQFLALVTDIRLYPTLEAYISDVTVQKALPGVASFDEALKVYYQWSTPDEIQLYGFLGIFIRPLE